MTVDALRDELRAGARDHEESLDHLFEVALALGVADLLEVFGDLRDEDAARAVVFALAQHAAGTPEVRAPLRAALADDRSFVVAEALDGLAHGETAIEPEALDRLARHDSPFVRGAVLRYVAQMQQSASIGVLLAGLEDASYIVRENAIDELEGLGAGEAVPALRSMLSDAHPDVREAARGALQTLADG